MMNIISKHNLYSLPSSLLTYMLSSADGRERPFGIVLAYHVTVYDAWEAGCRGNCTLERWYTNLAVVMFEQPVGSTVGFFGLAASDEFTINATIAGYPNDKPFGEMVSLLLLSAEVFSTSKQSMCLLWLLYCTIST